MTRRLRASARRAMADALRHMKDSGIRLTDLRHGSGATHAQIEHSLDRIFVPRRDDIGFPPAALAPSQASCVDVVSPRHVSFSRAGGTTSQLAGRKGADAPLAPALFPEGLQGTDGLEQGRADTVVVGVDLSHHHDLHVVAVGSVDDAEVLSWQHCVWHPVSHGEATP